MDIPVQSKGVVRRWNVARRRHGITASAGVISNQSSQSVWITADNQRHCLGPHENSRDHLGIDDADGLLLDGRGVLFDSIRTDLGGGQVHYVGAFKVCDLGTMTIHDAPTVDPQLIVEISAPGLVCPGESAGYHDTDWCNAHGGWSVSNAPIGSEGSRSCNT